MGFADDLIAWHSWWIFTGTAAATLAGLVFVAMSLRMRDILASQHAAALARGTFYYFLSILAYAAFMLVPWSGGFWLSVSLGLFGATGLFQTLRSIWELRKAPTHERHEMRSIPLVSRFLLPLIARAMAVVAAAAFYREDTRGFLVLATSGAILLVVGANNAWDLVAEFKAPAPGPTEDEP